MLKEQCLDYYPSCLHNSTQGRYLCMKRDKFKKLEQSQTAPSQNLCFSRQRRVNIGTDLDRTESGQIYVIIFSIDTQYLSNYITISSTNVRFKP